MIRKAWLGLATAAGVVVRAAKVLPGLLGAAAISWGLGMVYEPLLYISAGVALIVIDWRIP